MELPNRSVTVVVIEASICIAMNVISLTGNLLVCLAVYKNPKLRSTINLYIIALAVSDLLCATVEMPLTSVVLITGKWHFSDALCQMLGFVDAFVTYVTPATMGLMAFNRYMRIVKTNHYKKIFSPRNSKIWLHCVWLSLTFYLMTSRVASWSTFEFIPGYAVCSIAFIRSENRITHYCIVFGLFFALPFFIGFFSYYKVFMKIRQHELGVGSSLQNSSNGAGRISRQEINISRVLSYVAAGFLICWVPMWGFIFWKRFSPDTAPRVVQLIAIFLLFLSSTINPFIYAVTNRVFREEFRKLLCWWRVRKIASEIDSHQKGEEREKIEQDETAV